MSKVNMDLGSVIVEVEEVAPGTLMLTREISRKRGYRVRTKREAYVNWDRTIKAPEVPYRGLGNDPVPFKKKAASYENDDDMGDNWDYPGSPYF